MYTEDTIFEDRDVGENPLPAGEYEGCTFKNCNLAGVDLSGYAFIDCSFTDCDWSLAKLARTVLRDLRFSGCKLMGLHFEDCAAVSFSADNSLINHSSFYQVKMKKTNFLNSQLVETDFTECDLTGAVFAGCNLDRALFERTILEKADLRTAYNYTIDPEKNTVKKARFSVSGLPGLLRKYNIDIEGMPRMHE